MRIHSFSKLLALPLILATGFFAYRMFSGNFRGEQPYILIPVILLTILYVSYGQIDYWWLKKYPIPLDDKIKDWLVKYLPYYNNLSDTLKVEFEKRLGLYVDAREFKIIGNKELDDIPFDVKNILASQAIKLSLGQEDFLIKDMDRIYLYKHPFPSPRYQFLHTYESDVVDGVIILSLEQAIPGIVQPKVYYNITLHAFAEAFVHLHPHINFPDVNKYGWEELEKIATVNKESIINICGYPSLDLLVVHIVLYFEYKEDYKQLFSKEYKVFSTIFNQNINKI